MRLLRERRAIDGTKKDGGPQSAASFEAGVVASHPHIGRRVGVDRSREIVASEVRSFLLRNAPGSESEVAALADDAVIWGVVDSLLVLDLVLYLERRFELTVPPTDLIPDNFMTVGDIVRYVHGRSSP